MGSPHHQSVDIAEIDPPAQTATVHGKLHQSTPEQLHTLDANAVTQSKAESLSMIEGSCQLSQVEASQQPAGTDKHPRSKMGHQGLRFLDKSLAGKGGWKTIEKRFDKSAVNGRLHKENFGPCIGMAESKEFAGKLFVALARRRNLDPEKGITKEELNEYWKGMTDQNFESRLRIFFDMCDNNGDGKLTEDEVKEVIVLSASANKLSKLKAHAATYAALVMKELDPDNFGYIEVIYYYNGLFNFSIKVQEPIGEDLETEAEQYRHLYNLLLQISQLETLVRGLVSRPQGSERTFRRSHGLAKTMMPRLHRNRVHRCVSSTAEFIQENWKKIWILSLWAMLNIALAAWKFEQYRRRSAFQVMGYCVCIAKAAAETLKLNMALILIPVCRNTLTRLRSTALSSVFPFDDNINFHKIIALAIAIGALVHTLAHVTCDFPRLITCPNSKFMTTLGPYFNYKQPTYPSLLASAPGLTGIFMVMIMAFSFTLATHSFRRSVVKLPSPLHHLAGFNAFWYAHHLLALVYVLLVVHSYFIFLTKKWYKKTVCHAFPPSAQL